VSRRKDDPVVVGNDAAPPPVEAEPAPVTRQLPEANPIRQFNGVAIPAACTHFRLRRHPSREPLTFGQREGVVISEWPIDDLSGPEVLRRHGPGTYRVVWVVRHPDGKPKVLPYGMTFEILAPARAGVASPSVADSSGHAAPAAPFACCGVDWPTPLRFCGSCGKPSPASAASGLAPAALSGLPSLPTSAVGGDLLLGFKLATEIIRDARSAADAEADRRLERERQDFQMRIERERHQFDMDLKAQQARHEIMLRDAGKAPDVNPADIARQVADAVGKRIEELEDQISDVQDDVETAGKAAESTMQTVLGVAREWGPHLAPLVQGLAAKLATPAAAVVNGAAKA
jgi:hypothetical protein